ncbi:MAG TPA: ABC transporter ATP-binding protein [Solirubrobacteraceae bacterium]|nr:ABC transporter ATP-binding protein [Solirubrobacteraceae bacterium]
MELVADITLPRRSFELRVRLTLETGTVALVGPSGAGKTSLLRALAGLERGSRGRITLGDELWMDTEGRTDLPPEHRRVGYLPQDYALFPHLSVAGNVRFAARRDRPDLLERLRIAHLASERPQELSGGERQRVALARALAREPRLLLLDEPFAALDAITRDHVRSELANLLPTLGLPTLLVTHAFEDASALAGRIGVLDRGQVVQLGSAAELLESPATQLVAQLTGANTLAGIAEPAPGGSLVRLDGGGALRTSEHASGKVDVAIDPWAVTFTEPNASELTDTVVSASPERGSLVVRLTRMTAKLPLGVNGGLPLVAGAAVGLRVAPEDVRVFAAQAHTGDA